MPRLTLVTPTNGRTLFARLATGFMGSRDRIGQDVKPDMLTVGEEHQVFRAIIRTVMIHMVDYLARFQKATVSLFPDKPMFKYITPDIGRRMVRHIYIPIVAVLNTSTFPLTMLGTFLASHIMSMNIAWSIRLLVTGAPSNIVSRNLLTAAAGTNSTRRYTSWRQFPPFGLQSGPCKVTPYIAHWLALNIPRFSMIARRYWSWLSTTTFAKFHSYISSPFCRHYSINKDRCLVL